MELLNQIKATARGAAILKEWLGDECRPVRSDKAWARAFVCAACPHNALGNWWDSVKSFLANTIRQYLAVKRAMRLTTPHDSRLGTCEVCKCNNPLQVWVPIHHVRKHTPASVIEKFPDPCWKKKELVG